MSKPVKIKVDPEYFRKRVNANRKRIIEKTTRDNTLYFCVLFTRSHYLEEGVTCYQSVTQFLRSKKNYQRGELVYALVAYAELYSKYQPTGNVPMRWKLKDEGTSA